MSNKSLKVIWLETEFKTRNQMFLELLSDSIEIVSDDNAARIVIKGEVANFGGSVDGVGIANILGFGRHSA